MSLSSPAMLMGVGYEACVAWMRMPRKRRISPAASEDPDITLLVHPTSEVLLRKRDVWVFDILDVRSSSTSQLITIPDSSISLMVRVTSLNRYFTFCCHSYCHMIGTILFRTDV